jgi:hypothetical protein
MAKQLWIWQKNMDDAVAGISNRNLQTEVKSRLPHGKSSENLFRWYGTSVSDSSESSRVLTHFCCAWLGLLGLGTAKTSP